MFIPSPDFGGGDEDVPCDPHLQDCPSGHKCAYFAAPGEDWYSARALRRTGR